MFEEFKNKSVAIIGSGNNIIGKNNGVYIDTFDYVIRFNRSITDGYNVDVGNKTTHRIINPLVYLCRPLTPDFPNQDQNFIKKVKNQEIIVIGLNNKKIDDSIIDPTNNVRHIGHQECLDFNKKNNLKQPTVGYFTIIYLLNLNYDIDIELFGFSVDDGDKASHYWESRSPKSKSHFYNKEREHLKMLELQGKISINK